MPPVRLQARPEHSPIGREPRSLSGAVFDFVVIPLLIILILAMSYEIACQLWLVDGHFL